MNPTEEALIADIKASNAAVSDEAVEWIGKSLYTRGWRLDTEDLVTDPTELDRYPIGTVLFIPGRLPHQPQVWQRVTRTSYCWSAAGFEGRHTSEVVLFGTEGASVLFEPRQ